MFTNRSHKFLREIQKARRIILKSVFPLRAGSVVADMEAVVPNDVTVTSSAASLSVGVLALAGSDVTVSGQIGYVSVVVGNLTGGCFCLHLTVFKKDPVVAHTSRDMIL